VSNGGPDQPEKPTKLAQGSRKKTKNANANGNEDNIVRQESIAVELAPKSESISLSCKRPRSLSPLSKLTANAESDPSEGTTAGKSAKRRRRAATYAMLSSASGSIAAREVDDVARDDSEEVQDAEEDIDAMFDGKRKKRAAKPSKRSTPGMGEPTAVWGVPSRSGSQRYTKDGLRILTEDDIKAENTQDLNGECPFDCSCCF
jgi:hypothetical protein